MQRNPFFEEVIVDDLKKSHPFTPSSSYGSSPFNYTTALYQSCRPSLSRDLNANNMASIKRERPRPVTRQISLPEFIPKAAPPDSDHSQHGSVSESTREWEDSFHAFASSRLNSPKGNLPQIQPRTSSFSNYRCSYVPSNNNGNNHTQEPQTCEEEPPPLPPRKLKRTSVSEIYSNGWLHRGQELAVHKEACLLSQTGVASLQRGREGEGKRNTPSVSPDPHTSSVTSDSFSIHSQKSITPLGFMSEENPKKFKYEPLEDDADCWGGMLFEQDLYRRVCRGNFGQPKVSNQRLSLNSQETAESTMMCKNNRTIPDTEMSVTETLKMSALPRQSDVNRVLTTPEEQSATVNKTTCMDATASVPVTSDLNMNESNLDFVFIDSDGSSQSEMSDTLKGLSSLDGRFQQVLQTSSVTLCHETTPKDVLALKDTYIPEMNTSFEILPSSNNLCKVSRVHQDFRDELSNSRDSSLNQASDLETESSDEKTKGAGDRDDNGNPQANVTTITQTGVVSARVRPKGRANITDHPNSQSKSEDREFEQLLSLVQNISGVSEGPLSYQPTKSALSSLLALDSCVDQKYQNEFNTSSKDGSSLSKNNYMSGSMSEISFEDLHAKVAPNLKSNTGQEPGPCSPISPTLALSADAQSKLPPFPVCSPSMHPSSVSAGGASSLTMAPYTSSSSSYSTTSTTDQPLSDALHTLLPEETQPASSLPRQESR